MHMSRKNTDRSFLLIKIIVVAVVQFSVIGFLDETANRTQVRLQPFRAIAILAIAMASSYPITLMVDLAKRKVMQDDLEDLEELEYLEPAPNSKAEAQPQISKPITRYR
jgi:hypothetical protein